MCVSHIDSIFEFGRTIFFESIFGLVGSSISSFVWVTMPEDFVKYVPFMPYLRDHLGDDVGNINGNEGDLEEGNDEEEDDDNGNNNNNNGNYDNGENEENRENEHAEDEAVGNGGGEGINVCALISTAMRTFLYSYLFDALCVGMFVLLPFGQGKMLLNVASFLTGGMVKSGNKLVESNNLLSVRIYIIVVGYIFIFLTSAFLWSVSSPLSPGNGDSSDENGRGNVNATTSDIIITILLGVIRIIDGLFKISMLVVSMFFFIPVIAGSIPKVLHSPVHFEYDIVSGEPGKFLELLI